MASLSTLPSFPLTSIYHIPPLKESKENNVLIFIPGNQAWWSIILHI